MGTTLIESRRRGADLSKCTVSEQTFVAELVANNLFDPTRAARKAGYKNPSQAANKLMKRRRVKAALGKALKERMDRCELTADRVLKEVEYCALRDPIGLCDKNGFIIIDKLSSIPEQLRRCIDGIECRQYTDENGRVTQVIKLKLVSKAVALELAMKHFGMLAPLKVAVKVQTDWEPLYGDDEEPMDEVETRLIEESK